MDDRGRYLSSECKSWGDRADIAMDSMFFDKHPEALENSIAALKEILKKAEERARVLVSEEEIYKNAQAKATEILNETRQKSKAAERAALEFTESVLNKSENAVMVAYNEIKNTRMSLKNRQEKATK